MISHLGCRSARCREKEMSGPRNEFSNPAIVSKSAVSWRSRPRPLFLTGVGMTSPHEEAIRARAKQLWEQAGRPEGRDQEFWLQAELDLKKDAASNPDEKSKTFLE